MADTLTPKTLLDVEEGETFYLTEDRKFPFTMGKTRSAFYSEGVKHVAFKDTQPDGIRHKLLADTPVWVVTHVHLPTAYGTDGDPNPVFQCRAEGFKVATMTWAVVPKEDRKPKYWHCDCGEQIRTVCTECGTSQS